MLFVRRLLIGIMVPLLPLLLVGTAVDFSVLRITGEPETVKRVINDSGIYRNVVVSALAQAEEASGGGQNLPLSDPAVKDAAQKALSPTFIKGSTDDAIDSIYAWLNGKTDSPDFRIDLTGVKARFADLVGQAALSRAAGLPPCTSPGSASIDPFSATCLPPGVTPQQVSAEARNSAMSNEGFLSTPVISAEDLQGRGGGQSVFDDQLRDLPRQYQLAKKSPYVLGLLALLLAAGIVLLSASWQRGLRKVGVIFLITGILMFFLAWGLSLGVDRKVMPAINFDDAVLQANAKALVEELSSSINRDFYLFGGGYALAGVGALFAPLLLNRQGRRTGEKHPAAAAEAEAKPADKPKPKPPKKIQ